MEPSHIAHIREHCPPSARLKPLTHPASVIIGMECILFQNRVIFIVLHTVVCKRITAAFHAHTCTTEMLYIKSNFERSKTLLRNAGELTDKTKVRSNNCSEILSSPNYRLNVPFESSSSVNYHSNFCVERNNRCHKISSKSREKPGISSNFACITFAQILMKSHTVHAGMFTYKVSCACKFV